MLIERRFSAWVLTISIVIELWWLGVEWDWDSDLAL